VRPKYRAKRGLNQKKTFFAALKRKKKHPKSSSPQKEKKQPENGTTTQKEKTNPCETIKPEASHEARRQSRGRKMKSQEKTAE